MSKYINPVIFNKNIILNTSQGLSLLVNVDYNSVIKEEESTDIACTYLLLEELDLSNVSEKDMEGLDYFCYVGYWNIDYIRGLLECDM